jgi:3D (Asp-Asp-Asp) domain-containing protein
LVYVAQKRVRLIKENFMRAQKGRATAGPASILPIRLRSILPKGVVKLIWLKILFTVFLSIGLSNHSAASASEEIDVTVTAYSTAKSRNNRTVAASSVRLTKDHHWKVVALSPDLAKSFKYGDEFELRVNGKLYNVVYHDRSSKSHKKKVDLLLPSLAACKKFGRVKGKLRPIRRERS